MRNSLRILNTPVKTKGSAYNQHLKKVTNAVQHGRVSVELHLVVTGISYLHYE